jgi:hypothetical protein
MKYQSPDSNNPSNPLIKVAALTLDKEYAKVGKDALIKVQATLNFKQSSDLSGTAETKDGEDVTVCFSLAIRRASFEVSFQMDDGQVVPAELFELIDVAFHSPLQLTTRITDHSSVVRRSRKAASIGAAGQAAVRLAGPSVGFRLRGKTLAKKDTASRTKRSTSSRLERANVNVTFSENRIHWEIKPLASWGSAKQNNVGLWLEGEVFRSHGPRRQRAIEACKIRWKREKAKGALVITGSVFTSMEDLIIDDIRFLTKWGEQIPWKKMDKRSSTIALLPSLPLQYSKAKERFVRQVIRKHLVSQGMLVEGARVEICRANT